MESWNLESQEVLPATGVLGSVSQAKSPELVLIFTQNDRYVLTAETKTVV
jgi:hypothetical protein